MVALLFQWLLFFALPIQGNFYLESSDIKKHATVFHPFYVSVTEINHNAKDKTLEISCKIFADDMEEVLKKNNNKPVDLANAKQLNQNNQYVADYIQKRLTINVDGKNVKLSFIGFEKDKESVYCYFEVPNVPSLKKIDLTNSLLQDLNDEQINIMHMIVNGNRKSYKLDFPKKDASFSF
jgi:hypothetical protein